MYTTFMLVNLPRHYQQLRQRNPSANIQHEVQWLHIKCRMCTPSYADIFLLLIITQITRCHPNVT